MESVPRLKTAAVVLGLLVSVPCRAEAARTEIRGAALGMTLVEAMDALTKSGAICGKGLFDTHRCDFDADTWIHLHVVGPNKIVEAIRYTYPALRDPERFAAFRAKVVTRYSLNPVDNRSRFVTPRGAAFTIEDGQIDLETDLQNDLPTPPEPQL